MYPSVSVRWISIVVALLATAGVLLAPASSLGQQPEQPTPRSREEAAAAKAKQREQAVERERLHAEADSRELFAAIDEFLVGLRHRWAEEQERISAQVERLKEAVRRAWQENRRDEVEQLRREAREMMEDLQRRWPDHLPPRPLAPSTASDVVERTGRAIEVARENGERMRRLGHARIAVANLRAAGMPGLAEEVQREVDRLEREWNKQQPQVTPEGPRQPAGLGPSRDTNADRQLNELRAEIESLRRELENLRRDFHGRKPDEPQRGSDDTPWWTH